MPSPVSPPPVTQACVWARDRAGPRAAWRPVIWIWGIASTVSLSGLSHRSSGVSTEGGGQGEETELACKSPPRTAGPEPGIGGGRSGEGGCTWGLGGMA